jgi:hypothetical protein
MAIEFNRRLATEFNRRLATEIESVIVVRMCIN